MWGLRPHAPPLTLSVVLRDKSIRDGITRLVPSSVDPLGLLITHECLNHIISQYLGKVVVVSHTEKGRKICDRIKITSEPDVIDKYLSQDTCKKVSADDFLYKGSWSNNVDDVLTKKSEKINIGLHCCPNVNRIDSIGCWDSPPGLCS